VQGHAARLEDHRRSQLLLEQPEAQQGMTMDTGGAGQASMLWPAMGCHAQRAALPPLWDDAAPPAGDECTLPADFAEAYGIQSTKVLTTSAAPGWWVCIDRQLFKAAHMLHPIYMVQDRFNQFIP
jgi:hypothetical protein